MRLNDLPKALIIEDNISSALTLKNILNKGKLTVLSSCGEQGVKVAMEENPNIILLEILLEKRYGFEILSNLKNNIRTKNIPVIIISKLNTQEYWDESYLLGAAGYLVKPNHYPWLLKRVNSIISKKLA